MARLGWFRGVRSIFYTSLKTGLLLPHLSAFFGSDWIPFRWLKRRKNSQKALKFGWSSVVAIELFSENISHRQYIFAFKKLYKPCLLILSHLHATTEDTAAMTTTRALSTSAVLLLLLGLLHTARLVDSFSSSLVKTNSVPKSIIQPQCGPNSIVGSSSALRVATGVAEETSDVDSGLPEFGADGLYHITNEDEYKWVHKTTYAAFQSWESFVKFASFFHAILLIHSFPFHFFVIFQTKSTSRTQSRQADCFESICAMVQGVQRIGSQISGIGSWRKV